MAENNAPPPADVSYETFYDPLAPYGSWVDVAGYGPCWQPTVVVADPGWQPYCNSGRWIYSDCGWYWSSGYSWGWAPFHYGRWFRHQNLGWCWAPGNTWGPAWVSWRSSGNYCGWAPLPPSAGFSAGIGLTFHGKHVGSSFGFGLGVNSFAFVNVSQFSNPHLERHTVPHSQATLVYRQTMASTTIVASRNRVINTGIPVSRVTAATHTPIRTVNIRQANAPVVAGARGERLDSRSGTLSVYRPQFTPSAGPTSPTAKMSPETPARSFGKTTTAQPNPTANFSARAQHPATAAPTTDAWQSRSTASRPDNSAHPAVPQWPRTFHGPEAQSQPQPRSYTPRTVEPAVRSERPREFTGGGYSAPAPQPPPAYSAPTPAPAPPPTRSYSAPAPSFTPRPSVPESRPAPSAPPSSSGGQSQSSAGKGWR